MRLCLLFLFLLVCGCASTEEGPFANPHPASYAADGFLPFVPAPQRMPQKKEEFYFNDCWATDGKTHYSKTSYYCEDR